MEVSRETAQKAGAAANRLHHVSMIYGAAVAELAKGQPVAFLPQGYPGLSAVRDLIDLALFCRAEINALTKCLLDAKVIDEEKFARQQAEEYDWFARTKAELYGFGVNDAGLVVTRGTKADA